MALHTLATLPTDDQRSKLIEFGEEVGKVCMSSFAFFFAKIIDILAIAGEHGDY